MRFLSSPFLSFLVLPVLLEDVLVRSTPGGHTWVVVSAQDIRSSLQCVMANPPTPLRVAVHLANTRVHPDADGADERCLTQVGAEAGPEVVVQVGPSVKGSSVQRQPMS